MKINRSDIRKLEDWLWEIPVSFRTGMRVPARILIFEEMLEALLQDRSLVQLVNVTHLPGIQKAAYVMPDAHEGYGFPIGGVAATTYPNGAISPGGIGYDINCGVRLLTSRLHRKEAEGQLESLSREMYAQIPSGMGKGGNILLSQEQMDGVLNNGARWALEMGYASPRDLLHTENLGCLEQADPACVSEMARKRGSDQLGTIGSGNHFVEVGYVEEIFDPDIAEAYALWPGQLTLLIHTGSRGLGHQVATDYIRLLLQSMEKYGFKLPDRELACVPFDSEEGTRYFRAMCAAANFAWCNRQIVSFEARTAWENVFGKEGGKLDLLYDVAHNICKLEDHRVDGEVQKLIVHRKGATRAFGPGFQELPESLVEAGQPVIIPGSMGTCSYVLAGTERSSDLTFGSSCHGAGRRLSRTAAKKQVDAPSLKQSLRERGIYVQAGSFRGIAEEAPIAYKDVNLVVDAIHEAGVAKKVARLRPLTVMKG